MIISSTTSNQIKAISFISMILVVFIHSYNLDLKFDNKALERSDFLDYMIQNFISNGIARVAVPVFYLISGLLFFKDFSLTVEKVAGKYKSRFYSIVIPYLFWSAWGILIFWLLQTIPYSRPFFSGHIIGNYSIKEGITVFLLDPVTYQLWFLRDLIIFAAISPLIYLYVKYTRGIGIIVLLAIWFFRYEFSPFDRDIEALVFFASGCFLSATPNLFDRIKIRQRSLAHLLLLSWAAVAILRFVVAYLGEPDLLVRYLLGSLNILIGIVAFWNSYFLIPESFVKRYVLKYAGFSFFIYCFHEPVLTIIKKSLFFLMKYDASLMVYFLSFIITIIISFLTAYFLKKYTIKFFHLITGGRQ